MALKIVAQACAHQLEPHVVYDFEAAGYRGQLRCRCHKVIRISRKIRERVAEAEADAVAMLTAKPRVRKPRPRVLVSPTSAQIGIAWKAWWRGKCAEHGHESRL